MAQYPHKGDVKSLLAAGMTLEEISAARPEIDISTYKDGSWDAITWNRPNQRAFEAWVEQKLLQIEAGTTAPLATNAQVNYIMDLLARYDGQNLTWFSQGPTTLKEIKLMTRRDASTYISALKGDY